MQKITVYGEFLFELKSKQDWINRVPRILPAKERMGEVWIWVDTCGHIFECGADFTAAEELSTYPCIVYRLCSISIAQKLNPKVYRNETHQNGSGFNHNPV